MMQRRTFAKAMASLLTVPLLKFQPETIDRHKLLSMFLDDDCFARWDLTRPYVVGDFSYGTDGRAMARIDTCESEHDDETVKIPPIENAWSTHFQPSQEWSSFKLAEFDQLIATAEDLEWGGTCPLCDNRRVSFGEDYPTDQATADELPDYDPDDNTIRDVSCELCRGKPYYHGSHQFVNGQLVAYRYAKKLAAIPDCEFCMTDFKHRDYKQVDSSVSLKIQNVLFRSDVGISGIVLPYNPRNRAN